LLQAKANSYLLHVINHAADRVIFIDEDLAPLLARIADQLTTVEKYVILSDKEELPEIDLPNAISYEKLLAEASPSFDFPEDLDENSPAAMCYTTATTGPPKGVIYTHRSIYLHGMMVALPDTLGVRERDAILPVVPMFHVLSWGIPYAGVWMGSKLVLPGRVLTPEAICKLIETEKVTLPVGVPTIWIGLHQHLQGGNRYDFSSVRYIVNGGSAISKSLIKSFNENFGIKVLHGYGMTETSPVVVISELKGYMDEWDSDRRYAQQGKQGLVVPGIEMKVVDENGAAVKWDGKEMGELCFRGPWIAGAYYRDPERSAESFKNGWLHTGDIVTVDEEGYIFIQDRSKDLIKSGGEWISSIDLENTIMAHPAVVEAAVIAVPDEKWVERPLACVVLKETAREEVTQEDILDFLKDKVAKWWIPDRVLFLDEIPKTSVGKFNKKLLRETHAKPE
jgi:fatty-acyl-CoA synthase